MFLGSGPKPAEGGWSLMNKNIEKWAMACKIHLKRREEDAQTRVIKAHESDGQQKQLLEFRI
jgi:hypothetical protein